MMAWRGSPGSAHSGTAAGASRSRCPSATSRPDHRVQYRLRHRPAEQRCLGCHRRGRTVEVLQRALVALGHDAPAVDDQHGEGLGHRPIVVEDLVEQRVEVDARRHVARGPVLGGPGRSGGLRRQRDQAAHHRGEERQQRGVGLGRLLLLHPVGGARRRRWCPGSRAARRPSPLPRWASSGPPGRAHRSRSPSAWRRRRAECRASAPSWHPCCGSSCKARRSRPVRRRRRRRRRRPR